MYNGTFIKKNMQIFCCPKCEGDLVFKDNMFECKQCLQVYPFENNIPCCFCPNDYFEGIDTTDIVKSFCSVKVQCCPN
jgi:uncharacterized protein YbaR (Trm112 family)